MFHSSFVHIIFRVRLYAFFRFDCLDFVNMLFFRFLFIFLCLDWSEQTNIFTFYMLPISETNEFLLICARVIFLLFQFDSLQVQGKTSQQIPALDQNIRYNVRCINEKKDFSFMNLLFALFLFYINLWMFFGLWIGSFVVSLIF